MAGTLPFPKRIDAWKNARARHINAFKQLAIERIAKAKDGFSQFVTEELKKTRKGLNRQDTSDKDRRRLEIYRSHLVDCNKNIQNTNGLFELIHNCLSCDDKDKNLLTAPAEKLLWIVAKIQSRYHAEANNEVVMGRIQTVFEELYKKFVVGESVKCEDGSSFFWDAGEFIRLMGIRVCPYCNAETVYTFPQKIRDKTKKGNYKSSLDHFLPISVYPYLGLSLANLVPSCTRCNSVLKHNQDPLNMKSFVVSDKNIEKWIEMHRMAHPYIDDIYDKTNLEFEIVWDDEVETKNIIGQDDLKTIDPAQISFRVEYKRLTDCKVKDLIEGIFLTKSIINELYMPEMRELLFRMQKDSPLKEIALQQFSEGKINLGNADRGRLICGFEPKYSMALEYLHGKLFLDLMSQLTPELVIAES